MLEALSNAEAEKTSFQLMLQEGWTGDAKVHFASFQEALQTLRAAHSKVERIAKEFN